MSSVTGFARPLRASAAASALALLATVALATDEAATGGDLAALMGHFAASRGVEAAFREEKTIPLLQQPLVSEGVLYYAPPGRMVRFTTRPEKTSLLVVGDRLRMEDGLGVDEIDLAAHRDARRFVDQLMLLFQGDERALERDYEVGFEVDGSAWSLTLVPRGVTLRQVIREIALRGREDRLDEMVIAGRQGEITRTTYGEMQTDRPFSGEELALLFPAAGSPVALEPPGAPAQ